MPAEMAAGVTNFVYSRKLYPKKNQMRTSDSFTKSFGDDLPKEPGAGECRLEWQPVLYPAGKIVSRDPAVSLSWLDRLFEKGERNSRCYDFIEHRPFWTMGWFRAMVVLLGIFGILFWLFAQPL